MAVRDGARIHTISTGAVPNEVPISKHPKSPAVCGSAQTWAITRDTHCHLFFSAHPTIPLPISPILTTTFTTATFCSHFPLFPPLLRTLPALTSAVTCIFGCKYIFTVLAQTVHCNVGIGKVDLQDAALKSITVWALPRLGRVTQLFWK